jgi:hypothetical protein
MVSIAMNTYIRSEEFTLDAVEAIGIDGGRACWAPLFCMPRLAGWLASPRAGGLGVTSLSGRHHKGFHPANDPCGAC